MKISCRLVASLKVGRYADPKQPGASSLTLSEEQLATGTIADLAILLGQGSIGKPPVLGIAGFTLPDNEPLASLLREGDEVLMCPAATPATPLALVDCPAAAVAASLPLAAAPASSPGAVGSAGSDREAKRRRTGQRQKKLQNDKEEAKPAQLEHKVLSLQKEAKPAQLEHKVVSLRKDQAGEAEKATARAAELEVLTEQQATQIQVLQDQVASLQKRLDGMTASKPKSTGSAAASYSWDRVASCASLAQGAIIRYRLDLVDAWGARPRLSGLRTSTVAKVLPGADGSLSFVLVHANGAMDCVEASRLQEVHVSSRSIA